MFCANCGNELPEGSRCCPYCGQKVDLVDFELDEETQVNQNQSVHTSNTEFREDIFQDYPPQRQKNNKGNGLMIALIAVIAVLVIACGIGITVLLGVWDKDSDSDTKTSGYTAPTLAPTQEAEDAKEGTAVPTETITVTPAPTEKPTATPTPTAAPASSDYIIADSSTRLLTASDLSGLSAWEIKLARNEIYAKHGRMFKSADLDEYFRGKSWYNPSIPADSFQESYLNDTERANINTIASYEKAHGLN